MRPDFIVYFSPFFYLISSIAQAEEKIYVAAFVPQLPIKGLYMPIVGRTARAYEFELNPVPIRPCIHRLTVELRAIIHLDTAGCATLLTDAFKVRHDMFACQGEPWRDAEGFACIHVQNR